MTADTPLRISGAAALWRLEGELDRHSAAALRRWSEGFPGVAGPLRLELGELEIVDGDGASQAIDAIRLLLQRSPRLTLSHAPQTLAHTLYRVGMLGEGSRIELLAPREEEPYG